MTTGEAIGLASTERDALGEAGYVMLHGMADESSLQAMSQAYEKAWKAGEEALTERLRLLRYPAFRAFIERPQVQAAPRAVFGDHVQLLDYWLTFQPAASRWRSRTGSVPTDRDWHRDVSFLGGDPRRPIILNMLLFLDDVDERSGQTVVLPGSHRNRWSVVSEHATERCRDEVAVPLLRGDALLFNSQLVHSRGRNRSNRPRRGVAMLWGYWFIKPVDADLPVCAAGVEGASDAMLSLLGVRQPTVDQYLFEAF